MSVHDKIRAVIAESPDATYEELFRDLRRRGFDESDFEEMLNRARVKKIPASAAVTQKAWGDSCGGGGNCGNCNHGCSHLEEKENPFTDMVYSDPYAFGMNVFDEDGDD